MGGIIPTYKKRSSLVGSVDMGSGSGSCCCNLTCADCAAGISTLYLTLTGAIGGFAPNHTLEYNSGTGFWEGSCVERVFGSITTWTLAKWNCESGLWLAQWATSVGPATTCHGGFSPTGPGLSSSGFYGTGPTFSCYPLLWTVSPFVAVTATITE
jgi:hypothetical protein